MFTFYPINSIYGVPVRTVELLGKRIRSLRRDRDLTQAELAEKCGLSNNFIALLERGKNAPSIETLDALARVFKITISELFEFRVDMEHLSEREQALRKLARVSSRRDWELICVLAGFLGKERRKQST